MMHQLRVRAAALGLLVGLVCAPMLVHAQELLEGTTEFTDFERRAFACRSDRGDQEALADVLSVRSISDNIRAALRIGDSPENDWCIFLSSRARESDTHTGHPLYLGLLNPKFGYCLMNYVKELERTGYRVQIRSAVRSDADQAQLYAQGASGTNESYHEFGLAVDMGIWDPTGRETYEFAHRIIGDAWESPSGLRYMTRPHRDSDPHHLQADKSGRCGLRSEGKPDLSGTSSSDGTGSVEDVVARFDLTVVRNVVGDALNGEFNGPAWEQLLRSAFGGDDDRYYEEEAGERPSLAYQIGEFLGNSLFRGINTSDRRTQSPQATTVYYYETGMGTSTLYTVISVDREVLATSSTSASDAIAIATAGLDSYLVLQIDDPSVLPEPDESHDGSAQQDTGEGFLDFEQPGGESTFSQTDDGFLGGGFGGSTFGSGSDTPVLGKIAEWFRNIFGALFGAGS